MRVDRDLNVKLLYKGSPLPQKPRKGLSSYEKRYDAKLHKLYQIRWRTEFNILEELKHFKFKKKIVQCYSIFTSSTLYFFTNILIINERVSISILNSAEKIHWGTTWCCQMSQIFKIASGDFRSIDVWWDVFTEMWRILWRWNNQCKWNSALLHNKWHLWS